MNRDVTGSSGADQGNWNVLFGNDGVTQTRNSFQTVFSNPGGEFFQRVTQEVAAPAVPLPADLPLRLADVGAFGVMRRKPA